MDTDDKFDLIGDRLGKLEAGLSSYSDRTDKRLNQLEQDVAVIKSNYATKADVSEMRNSIAVWVVSAFVLTQLLPQLLKAFGIN
jgi:hypothetical protein